MGISGYIELNFFRAVRVREWILWSVPRRVPSTSQKIILTSEGPGGGNVMRWRRKRWVIPGFSGGEETVITEDAEIKFLLLQTKLEKMAAAAAAASRPAVARLKFRPGGLFHKAPPGAILLHACNCMGTWGGGIALAFKLQFPKAFEAYHKHCLEHASNPRQLLGTCFIARGSELGYKYDVGCLFTSVDYGKNVDPPDSILEATKLSVQDLMAQNKEGKPVHSW